jgi:hypothetical protein
MIHEFVKHALLGGIPLRARKALDWRPVQAATQMHSQLETDFFMKLETIAAAAVAAIWNSQKLEISCIYQVYAWHIHMWCIFLSYTRYIHDIYICNIYTRYILCIYMFMKSSSSRYSELEYAWYIPFVIVIIQV